MARLFSIRCGIILRGLVFRKEPDALNTAVPTGNFNFDPPLSCIVRLASRDAADTLYVWSATTSRYHKRCRRFVAAKQHGCARWLHASENEKNVTYAAARKTLPHDKCCRMTNAAAFVATT